MKGFKDSTKTQYAQGGSNCYAKGGAVKGAAKVAKVMGEFKKGELHSGSKTGPKVTSPKQATAIALSEARNAGAKIPVKKARGGAVGDAVDRGNRSQELEAREEEGMIREGARRAARGAKNNPYAEPKETITRETITRSAPMVPIRRGPNGAGYKNSPLIPDVIEGPLRSMGIIGRKAGGLSAMPKGKK